MRYHPGFLFFFIMETVMCVNLESMVLGEKQDKRGNRCQKEKLIKTPVPSD